jgi:dTDP-4-dehydrorhamnose 3,5-epimerase
MTELSRQAEAVWRLQDYGAKPAIDGVAVIGLKRFSDEGGSLVELLRLGEPQAQLEGFRLAQINYSTIQPGVVKAFHVHRRQTDVWFVPPEDRVLLILADVRRNSSSEGRRARIVLGNGHAGLVRIPPGVAHGCRNLGPHPARIVYFTDLLFHAEPERCDEGRLPWDFLGREIWDVAWE